MSAAEARVRAGRDRLAAWLHGRALPVWWAFGIDHADGGFHETLGLRCEIRREPRRVRVIARQVFSFAVAGRLGWTGPWKGAVERGLDWFARHAVKPDATVRMVVEANGAPRDDSFNLYDQAFALFAYAAAATVVGDRAPVEAAAVALRERLKADYAHPQAGFEEQRPRSLPLKANPHMHLLEACLAWSEAGGDAAWDALADAIAGLCLTHFLDGREGWLREFFDGDWAPMPDASGRICEPGHQFEWAWLLVRWGEARGRTDAIDAARRLVDLGERYGVDPARSVAINETWDDGTVKDGAARLWPQTERIKGNLALARVSDGAERERRLAAVADAVEGLERYLAVDTPGLWRDRMEADGRFRPEAAPASSFYHIICAIEELDRAVAAF